MPYVLFEPSSTSEIMYLSSECHGEDCEDSTYRITDCTYCTTDFSYRTSQSVLTASQTVLITVAMLTRAFTDYRPKTRTCFMLNSTEHAINHDHKCYNANNCWHFNIYYETEG